jgi:hypothetical protein
MASQDEQEFVRRLEEQLRQLKIADYLAQTVMTISQLAWQRLSGDTRDLDQARLAIEALRALVPVLKDAVPDALARDLQQAVANLQLAYAGAVAQAGTAAEGETGSTAEPAASGGETGSAPGPAASRAEAASTPESAPSAGEAGATAEPASAADPDSQAPPGEDAPEEPVTES